MQAIRTASPASKKQVDRRAIAYKTSGPHLGGEMAINRTKHCRYSGLSEGEVEQGRYKQGEIFSNAQKKKKKSSHFPRGKIPGGSSTSRQKALRGSLALSFQKHKTSRKSLERDAQREE